MKLFNFLNESFQHYTVRHKPSGKTYKVTSMSQADAKTKAAVQHGGRSASRFSGTSNDQFEIVEGKIKDIVKALKGPGYYSLDKDNPDHPADISDKLRKKLSQKDEGKSPHKKGTAKYKKHMAAMHAEEVEVDEVAGPKDCWDGYKKDGTQPGTGKNKGKRVNKCVKEDDNFVYASDLLYFDKDGKEIGYMDFDGYDDANTNHSEEELQAIAQKFNISPKDGKVVGYFNASDDEVDFSDDSNDETYPEGSIGVYIDSHSKEESLEEAEEGMIGEPDNYYDAEDRTEAYNDLQDILQGNFMDDYIKDGVCPECAGSGYMDGEETFTNDDGEEEESSECDGFGNYGCDEGEMTQNDDGLPNWAEIAKHDERQAEKANRGPAPSQEQIMKILPRLHDDYVKSGRYNAFELPSILRQMYPELGKRQASSYVADFFKTFEEQVELRKLAGLEEDGVKPHKMYKGDKVVMAKDEDDHNRLTKQGYTHDNPKTKKIEEDDSDDVVVAKMLSKALGDPNRWMEMSPPELYAELESTNPESADMIAKVAKMLYDVRLQERTYKDVGVADVQKDARGKEFKFDKDAKQFKSGDGELADIKTKVGKDLMKKRKLAMKKSTPSYNKKSAPKKKGFIASLFNDLEG